MPYISATELIMYAPCFLRLPINPTVVTCHSEQSIALGHDFSHQSLLRWRALAQVSLGTCLALWHKPDAAARNALPRAPPSSHFVPPRAAKASSPDESEKSPCPLRTIEMPAPCTPAPPPSHNRAPIDHGESGNPPPSPFRLRHSAL